MQLVWRGVVLLYNQDTQDTPLFYRTKYNYGTAMEKEITAKENLLKSQPRTSLTVISRSRVVRIMIADIIRLSKHGSHTFIHTYSTVYETLYSLQEIINDLPVNDFFRVHRSHIVCIKRVTRFENSMIKIGDVKVPMTRYYKRQVSRRHGEMLEKGYAEFRMMS